MRSIQHSLIVVGVVLLLVGAAVSPPGQAAIEETTGVDPVGEADAVLLTLSAGTAAVGVGLLGCAVFCDSSDTAKVEATDAEQAMIDIYSSAAGAHDQAEIALTGMTNYAEDSQEIALMVGKNAAIRSYMNGSSEIQAETAAVNAVEDYYARKELRLIKSWNVSVEHYAYLSSVAGNESGLSNSQQNPGGATYVDLEESGPSDYHGFFGGLVNETITLSNGTSTPVRSIRAEATYSDASYSPVHLTPASGETTITYSGSITPYVTVHGVTIRSSMISGTDYSDLNYLSFSEYRSAWTKIDTVQAEAKSEASAFVNTTYDEWSAGKINESELIDPYLGNRYYSPEGNFSSWALSTYSSLGLGSPENLSTFGSMTVVSHSDNEIVTGILMSDGLPQNETFEVGTTYNATTLSGPQYVITGSQAYDLEGEFSISSMTNETGGNVSKVVYRDVSYQSSNLSEYQQLSEELAELREEIEAEKQDALHGGGLFGGFGFANPLSGLGGLVILGGVVWLLLSKRD